jgi:hypothetical protein
LTGALLRHHPGVTKAFRTLHHVAGEPTVLHGVDAVTAGGSGVVADGRRRVQKRCAGAIVEQTRAGRHLGVRDLDDLCR